MKAEYQSKTYNSAKTFLYLFTGLIFSILILILIGVCFKLPPIIGVVGLICLFILPFVLEKQIKQRFTKIVTLHFDTIAFSVNKYSSDNEIEESLNFRWDEIKSYKFNFGSSNSTILTIYLKGGESKVWSFRDNKTFQEALNSESIFSFFRNYVKQYNTDKDENNKIVLSKGLLNSKAGTTIIYSEAAIILAGFIFHVIMHPQSSFLTLFIGVGSVAQLFIKRKQEKYLYDNISKLDKSN